MERALAKSSSDQRSLSCQLLACDCEGTMAIDAKKLEADLGLTEMPEIFSNLCRTQLAAFEKTISQNPGQKVIVTCTQEAPLFEELAAEIEVKNDSELALTFVNIRENAGWSKSGKKAKAKITALIAESDFEVTPTGLIPVNSSGVCVVYGPGQAAIDVALKLSPHLNVSLLLSDTNDVLLPAATHFPIYKGQISNTSGSIGKFEIGVNLFAPLSPSSKSELKFLVEQNGATIECDLIFDLSGGQPLIGGNHKRDGYFPVDPQDAVKLADAMFEITDLVGEFEKPIFVSYDKSICAHSRSGQTGCNNCIDNCPTSAIKSNGDVIVVDNDICDGCGHCSSSCPTGAIAYAFPSRADLIGRSQVLLSTYLRAGGKNPVVLVYENEHGGELISAMARFGDGLAENVLPFAVHSITHLGHDILSAFFTSGVQSVVVLSPMKKSGELDALSFQIDLTNGFLSGMGFDDNIKVQLISEDDPDNVAVIVNTVSKVKMAKPMLFVASKNKRESARLALANLNKMAPQELQILDLPENAPYGEISIDKNACTLCLACVGACPASALGDHEDRPQVSFTEHACVQCGLCKATCPENAISLKARYNFDKSALSPVVLNSEEPLECTRCGKPFGSKSAIEKVIGILQGKNPMFQTSGQLAMLKMCENCRVIAMSETEKNPMTLGTVPKTLTANDILPEDEEPTKH